MARMNGARIRTDAEFAQQKMLAWHTAMLPYMKNPIPLDKFVGGKSPRAKGQELLMRAQALHKIYGG